MDTASDTVDDVPLELIEQLGGNNRNVDVGKLIEGLRAVQKMSDVGFRRAEYGLASPYGHGGTHSSDERGWNLETS